MVPHAGPETIYYDIDRLFVLFEDISIILDTGEVFVDGSVAL